MGWPIQDLGPNHHRGDAGMRRGLEIGLVVMGLTLMGSVLTPPRASAIPLIGRMACYFSGCNTSCSWQCDELQNPLTPWEEGPSVPASDGCVAPGYIANGVSYQAETAWYVLNRSTNQPMNAVYVDNEVDALHNWTNREWLANCWNHKGVFAIVSEAPAEDWSITGQVAVLKEWYPYCDGTFAHSGDFGYTSQLPPGIKGAGYITQSTNSGCIGDGTVYDPVDGATYTTGASDSEANYEWSQVWAGIDGTIVFPSGGPYMHTGQPIQPYSGETGDFLGQW